MDILADISILLIAIVGAAALAAVAYSAFRSWRCRDKNGGTEMNIPRHGIRMAVALLLVAVMAVAYLAEKGDAVDMLIDTIAAMMLAAILASLYGWTRLSRRKRKGAKP